MKLSIVIPAKNEQAGLAKFLPSLVQAYSDAEIIVVNDGSTDDTEQVALNAGVAVINHPYSKGNGASIKTGARQATGEYIVFMDADGQHKPEDIELLLEKADGGFDMVVGARKGLSSQASLARGGANAFYNKFASLITGHAIHDLTSGFRLVNAALFNVFDEDFTEVYGYSTRCRNYQIGLKLIF